MVLAWCSGLVLVIALLNCATCGPIFRRTRKGCFANFLSSFDGRDWLKWPQNVARYDSILFFATVTILLEYIIDFEQPGLDQYPLYELLAIGVLLFAVDYCVVVAAPVQRLLFDVILVGALVASAVGACNMQQTRFINSDEPSYNIESHLLYHHNDMFTLIGDPFRTFGSLGRLSFFSILGCAIIKVFPLLQTFRSITYLFIVIRSVSTLGLLTIPAYYGGTVQTMKTIGRAITGIREQWRTVRI